MQRAHADPQWSIRLALGGGAQLGDERADEGIFEMALRSELLFGAPGDEHARVGLAVDTRTADMDSFEQTLGLGLLIPTWRGYPIVLTATGGWAERQHAADRPIAVGTFAWGYRSYNFHSSYGLGFQAYVSARVDLQDPYVYEITGGVELDLAVLVLMPAGLVRTLFDRGDPHEE